MTAPRMTEAQRRAARLAVGRSGRLTQDSTVPDGTWRRMLGRMWRAGFIEDTERPLLTAAGRTEAFR